MFVFLRGSALCGGRAQSAERRTWLAGRPAGRPTNTQMDRGMGRKASEETRGDGKESKQRLTDK